MASFHNQVMCRLILQSAVGASLLLWSAGCDQPSNAPTPAAPAKPAPKPGDAAPTPDPNVEPKDNKDGTGTTPATPKPDPAKPTPDQPAAQPNTPKPSTAPEHVAPVNKGLPTTSATIGGKPFKLEVAVEPETRRVGLMGRTSIAEDGGMVFVFPGRNFAVQSFWMKDCQTDMDILYLDNSGRILTMHEMKIPEPRKPGQTEAEYERSLKSYSSRFPCGIVVELAPGMAKKLGLKEGDQVKLDLDTLKKQAK